MSKFTKKEKAVCKTPKNNLEEQLFLYIFYLSPLPLIVPKPCAVRTSGERWLRVQLPPRETRRGGGMEGYGGEGLWDANCKRATMARGRVLPPKIAL